MRTALSAAGVVLLAAACSSGSGASPATPTSPPGTSVAAEADSAPEGFQPDDYWFRGVITDIRDLRQVHGPFIVAVEVTEHLDGSTVQVGATLDIVQSYGFGPYRCFGQLSKKLRVGAEILVYAHTDGEDVGDLATCADERYFVLLTPVEAAATPAPPTCRPDQPDCQIVVGPAPSPTCPPDKPGCPLWSTSEAATPPPYPTCPADIHCVPILRTVTIDLWSCSGGPCEGAEEPGCQRSVSLQVGDESFAPDPFFCLVQFHAVPAGDYLVVVTRRVACGPACDALERCQVIASANRIAIEPVADGDCPVHVIS